MSIIRTNKSKSSKHSRDLPLTGFIGQGYIGKNYADDFESRGYQVIRYALGEPYSKNKDKIKTCDIVFIAVPTPTTSGGFDDSIVRGATALVGVGKTVVIKSTLLPGTTESIQEEFPNLYVMHSPEFLTEATAVEDAASPARNIIGIPKDTKEYHARAQRIIRALPKAPYEKICSAREAELIKYGGNCWFYFKVVFINILYDLAKERGCDWEAVMDSMAADPRIGRTHLDPVHQGGRGAGGHCFIKDFAAFSQMYESLIDDPLGQKR